MSKEYLLPSQVQTSWDRLTLCELEECDSAPQLADLLRRTDPLELRRAGVNIKRIDTSKPPSDVLGSFSEQNEGINYGIVDGQRLVGVRCVLPIGKEMMTSCFIGGGCHGRRYQTRSNFLLQSVIPSGYHATIGVNATRNTPSLLSTIDSGAEIIGHWQTDRGSSIVSFQVSPKTFAQIEPTIISCRGAVEMIRQTKYKKRRTAQERLAELGLDLATITEILPLSR